MRYRQAQSSNLLSRLVTLVLGALTIVAALTFSFFLLVAVLVIGAAAWIYFWWKKREFNRLMQAQERTATFRHPAAESGAKGRDEGAIIEGEATRVLDEREHPEA